MHLRSRVPSARNRREDGGTDSRRAYCPHFSVENEARAPPFLFLSHQNGRDRTSLESGSMSYSSGVFGHFLFQIRSLIVKRTANRGQDSPPVVRLLRVRTTPLHEMRISRRAGQMLDITHQHRLRYEVWMIQEQSSRFDPGQNAPWRLEKRPPFALSVRLSAAASPRSRSRTVLGHKQDTETAGPPPASRHSIL